MNVSQMLSQPWVERLGWTLIHFVWQGFSIAALYGAVRQGVGRKSSPNARYLIACVALAAMLATPLVTWEWLSPSDITVDAAYHIPSAPPAASAARIDNTALPISAGAMVIGVHEGMILRWVVVAWLAGALLFWVRLLRGWTAAMRMQSMLVRPAPPEWQQTLRQLSTRIGLSQPARLLVSALVQAPAVVGWLRPVVLVPVGALSGLPREHMEALLIHELAHIRRHDYLVNILQSVAEAFLFYHPAVWWVAGHIRAEREMCCDDVAASVSGDAPMYARALAQFASYHQAHFDVAVAATGGPLSDRIARLLAQSRPSRSSLGPGVLAVALLLGAAAYGLSGQANAQPAFEAASIKRGVSASSDPTHKPMWVRREPGGRLRSRNAPLILLIQRAYGVQAFQVVGGPSWINTDGYDIEAKPAANTDRNQMWLMLQTLLATRFQLTLSRETRVLPVYELRAAKSGLKLPAPKSADCVSRPPDALPTPSGPGKAGCGYVAGPFSGCSKVLRLEGRKVHVPEFIKQLSLVLGRPVLDKTNFSGEFDLKLSFVADDATMGLPGFGGPGDPGGSRLPTDPDHSNIFAALEEQLGLKLVPSKSPVDVLVVAHVEKPTSN